MTCLRLRSEITRCWELTERNCVTTWTCTGWSRPAAHQRTKLVSVCVCVCVCVFCVGLLHLLSVCFPIGLQYSFILQAVSRIPETAVFLLLAPPTSETSEMFHDSRVDKPDICGFTQTFMAFHRQHRLPL